MNDDLDFSILRSIFSQDQGPVSPELEAMKPLGRILYATYVGAREAGATTEEGIFVMAGVMLGMMKGSSSGG